MSLVVLAGCGTLNREQVGGKAWGVDRMLAMGLPVPPAFVLTTDECRRFRDNGDALDEAAITALTTGLTELQERTGRRLGDPTAPLLVSVRSGAARSMPGMMDTILNLGMTPDVQRAIAERSGDPGYAADLTRRLHEQFERVVGTPAPQDPVDQLRAAAAAVLGSWMSERAVAYRRHHGIADDPGTAVTVQAMVFGNLDANSGTGVLFTRNPLTGEAVPYGQWLPGGQGEDVVSGRFDALPLSELERTLPAVHAELLACAARLEASTGDVQDIEYTVESGRLFLLQTRAAKRSPDAAVRIAVEMCEAGRIDRTEALRRVTPGQVDIVLRPRVEPAARAVAVLLATGEPACPGIGQGLVVASCEAAEDLADTGGSPVLARPTTDPDDVAGMLVSTAIVTEIGGATSHAAVVSRELGTPCVVGTGSGVVAKLTGRQVTVDGTTGEVFEGILPLVEGSADDPALRKLLAWAGEVAGATGLPPEVLRAAQAALEGDR
ncbi:MAG: pyruvate, phosphate dikinase [Actinobacteria bacterium]|nr:pyruvate, phosphate dikinase [Actinomycetota bacterium]